MYRELCERVVNMLQSKDPQNKLEMNIWYHGPSLINGRLQQTYSAVIESYGKHPLEFNYHSRVNNVCLTKEEAYKFLLKDFSKRNKFFEFTTASELELKLSIVGY